MRSGPLRFLAAVLALWVCARAAILAPGWWGVGGEENRASPAAGQSRFHGAPASATAPAIEEARSIARLIAVPAPAAQPAGITDGYLLIRTDSYKKIRRRSVANASIAAFLSPSPPISIVRVEGCCGPVRPSMPAAPASAASASVAPASVVPASAASASVAPAPGLGSSLAPPGAGAGRWSGSAWLLVRRDRGGAALAPGGTLGGSQTGARLLYRVERGFALSARAYAPLRRTAGAEAALGVDWRPWPLLPLHLLAERRQALGAEGRSAFALTVHGGTRKALPLGLMLDAWGQAGMVGARSRDLFVDGAVRLSAPIGPVEVGGGAWGAAQPGAARLDAGPRISYRLPVRGATLRLSADWRFRLAGDAAPGSGPALTLATDF